jgi:hypothetical protein
MARTTALTGVITLSTKKIALTEQIAIREKATISFTGYGAAGAADLILAIVYNGALMAKLQPMVAGSGIITGTLDLNTEEIVAVFSGMAANARVKMSIVIWDVTNECTLVNDWIWVQNNPYSTDMDDPTAVDPITPGTYALIANGVTNGDTHTHQNSDGADLSPYYVKRVTTGANFRIATDGLTIEMKDVVLGSWHTLILANGSLGVGPAL